MSDFIGQSAAATGLTRTLAERAACLQYDEISDDAREVARQCLLDWLAVTRAGASEPVVRLLADEAREQGSTPVATLIGYPKRVSTQQAALVNGTAGHALDYDDVHLAIEGHPTAPIMPGLLALAESRGASGKELLTAFVSGYETACRIGLLVGPSHYLRGFHATATVGSLGAAAACARLMDLDGEATSRALSIAGTQAAGLKSMFGTMCKPLHCGTAARNGLMAATLAARGFESRDDVLECPQGFAATQSKDFHPDAALAEPSGRFHIRGNLFKFHAACYLTHAAIECASHLRDKHRLAPDQIHTVTVRVDPACDGVCNIAEPHSGLEAKFSLRLTTAMALAGIDTSATASYSTQNCEDSDIVRLRDRVHIELVTGFPRTHSEVSIADCDGTRYDAEHDAGLPADDLFKQRERLEHKFRSLLNPLGDSQSCERLLSLSRNVDQLRSVHEILAATM